VHQLVIKNFDNSKMYGTNEKIMICLVYKKIHSYLQSFLQSVCVCLWLCLQCLLDVVTVMVCCVHRCVTP